MFWSLAAAVLAGVAFSPKTSDRALEDLVRGRVADTPVAGAVLAVRIGDRLVYSGAAGCAEFDPRKSKPCKRKLTPDTKFRTASISKSAVALGVMALVDDGLVDLDRDASIYLGHPLRNPAYPDQAITVRHLLSHTSSVRDPEAYWANAPDGFQTLLDLQSVFDTDRHGHGPGDYFTYANLNFGILATIIERVSGSRFDRFMTDRVLAPIGLDAGFNWSGVSGAARRNGAALHRLSDGRWTATVDYEAMRAGTLPTFLAHADLDREAYLAAYEPGENATLFSPHGGLRASVLDLSQLALAFYCDERLRQPVWRFDPNANNGDTLEGLFEAFGLGLQLVDGRGRLFNGETLIGHAGEAYGLYAGAWVLAADPAKGRRENVSFAYAITGTGGLPPKGSEPAFNALEERLVGMALDIASGDHDPRPFDAERNAMLDIDSAIAAAQVDDRLPLIVLGGNWCHDSRAFAAHLLDETIRPLIEQSFRVVYVDVGRRDRNLEVATRFGVGALQGTPTVLILSSEGALLNAGSVHDWRNAASVSIDETRRYLLGFALQSTD